MNIMKNRKGITPVIAIVLLLMVTVGAVGIVYTQFQSLVGDPTEQVDQQQQNQNTNIRILRGGSNNTSITGTGPHNADNYGVLYLEIQNTGTVTRNTTAFRMTTGSVDHTVNGTGAACTRPSNSTLLDPQETYKCQTGIVFPKATNEVEVTLQLQGSGKSWNFICRPETTGASIC